MSSTLMSLLTTLAAFIVAIGILVSIHEFGHFWVARRCGIRVLRFSVGFGKPLWRRTAADGVEYMIGSIPLGGYVKLLDEREGNVAPADLPLTFNRAKPWKRILTLLAGPAANLLFAIAAYWVLLMVGVPTLKPVVGEVMPNSPAAAAGMTADDLIVSVQGRDVTSRDRVLMTLLDRLHNDDAFQFEVRGALGTGPIRQITIPLGDDRRAMTEPDKLLSSLGFEFWYARVPATVGQLVPQGPAEQAGIKVGDTVLSIDGQAVHDFVAMVKIISSLPNRHVQLQVQRGGEVLTIPVRIGEQTSDGHSVGRIGIGAIDPKSIKVPPGMEMIQQYGPVAALAGGLQRTWDTAALSLKMMWQMVMGQVSPKNLSGPISIAEYTGVAAQQGLRVFIDFLALISISIGIFNLLPLPMLDGGQVVYQLIEVIKGSPISERALMLTQQVGLAMLLMLLSLTLYNDIARHL